MPIISTDIEYRLSGGLANADPNASLGGIKSATELVDATLHNLFDVVTGDEGAAGDTEYRCIYVHNAHATITLQNPVVWISQLTPSADDEVDIALDGAGVGNGSTTGVAEVVADEQTAPVGEVFTRPVTKGAGLAIADLAPGDSQAIWIRRTVDPGAAAVNNNNAIITVEGETAA